MLSIQFKFTALLLDLCLDQFYFNMAGVVPSSGKLILFFLQLNEEKVRITIIFYFCQKAEKKEVNMYVFYPSLCYHINILLNPLP